MKEHGSVVEEQSRGPHDGDYTQTARSYHEAQGSYVHHHFHVDINLSASLVRINYSPSYRLRESFSVGNFQLSVFFLFLFDFFF